MGNNGKIRVLQLVEGFNLGGAEKKLKELVESMDRERFHTIVCSLGLGDAIKDEFEALRELGVEVIELKRNHRVDFGLLLQIAKLIKKEQIDIVMTTLFYADVLGPLAGKIGGAKAVFSWETISAPWWLYKRRLWPYRFAIRYCTKVISVSEATKKFLIEKRGVPEKKVLVIPYGVDLEKYYPYKNGKRKDILGISENSPVIGMVGRLVEQKGHVYLIEAAEIVVKRFPTVKFVIVGDGELMEKLIRMVEKKKLAENFLFLGFRDTVPELLRSFDIFTLPSLYEGLPNVVLEAMATSLPVVATPADGTKEAVIDKTTGFLVPVKDEAALADDLIRLLKDHKLAEQMGEQGRHRVEETFSLNNQIQSFENLYETYA